MALSYPCVSARGGGNHLPLFRVTHISHGLFLLSASPRNCCSSFPKGKIVEVWQLSTPFPVPSAHPFCRSPCRGPGWSGGDIHLCSARCVPTTVRRFTSSPQNNPDWYVLLLRELMPEEKRPQLVRADWGGHPCFLPPTLRTPD